MSKREDCGTRAIGGSFESMLAKDAYFGCETRLLQRLQLILFSVPQLSFRP